MVRYKEYELKDYSSWFRKEVKFPILIFDLQLKRDEFNLCNLWHPLLTFWEKKWSVMLLLMESPCFSWTIPKIGSAWRAVLWKNMTAIIYQKNIRCIFNFKLSSLVFLHKINCNVFIIHDRLLSSTSQQNWPPLKLVVANHHLSMFLHSVFSVSF